MPGWGEVVAN